MGNGDRKRLLILAVGTFFLFSLLVVQFYKVQMIEHEKWEARAENQHYFTISEPFRRGRFFSNASIKQGHPERDQPLVMDIQKFHLYLDPYSIKEPTHAEVKDTLASFLASEGVTPEFVQEQLDRRKSRSRNIAMWLSREKKEEIRQWWLGFARKHKLARNAIFFIKDYQRSYPFGKLFGQGLHTIQDRKDETTRQAKPTGGLELQFNEQLQGTLGRQQLLRSPRNALATGTVIEEPENGADIYLTINHILQAVCEEEIANGVIRAEAKGGWAVMMDPYTGDILALAQYPFFYPANYRTFFNDPEKVEDTKVKALTDALEPGSTMKPITLAIALQANEERRKQGRPPFFTPEEKIATRDGRFPGRRTPLRDTRPHNFLNMYMGLQVSSNIYLGRVVQRVIDGLGNEWYRQALAETFGFGTLTNVELPAESAGVLPTPGKMHPNGTLEWSKATPYSLAMGYNLQVNSIQMLRAWAVLINGGRLVQPSLVRRIVKGGTETVPERTSRQVLDPKVCEEVQKALKFVTKSTGASKRGNIPGYTEAGKTGTVRKLVDGRYSTNHYYASFLGYAPTKHPHFLLYVVLDEPKVTPTGNYYGSRSAAPIFGLIAKRSLEYLGVAPDDPYGYPKGHPMHDPDKADWMAETRALQALYDQWNRTE